jgi:multimeric flavodoxin WrbA
MPLASGLIFSKNMIKIIGINSSLRDKHNPITQHDSYTRVLLKFGLDYIRKKYKDVEVEIIDLGKFNILPEQGAYSTDENFVQLKHPNCKDDMLKIIPKILEADGIIFSSPVYWGYPSGLLKTFFDRLIILDEISDDPSKRRLQGKVAGAISTAKFDGSSRVAQDILIMANYLGLIVPPHAFSFHTGRMTASVMEDDKDFEENYFAKRNTQIVVENIYFMAKLVKNKKWKIFQEFTHPLSDDEKAGKFDIKKEQKRFKDNKYFKDFNKRKGLV